MAATTTPWVHGVPDPSRPAAGAFADGAPVGGLGDGGYGPAGVGPAGYGTPGGGYGPGPGAPGGAGGVGGGGGFGPGDYGPGSEGFRPASRPDGVVSRATKAVSRIRSIEGPRGYSTRMSVALRHVGYLLTVVGSSALTHWAFQVNQTWRMGGQMMLFSATFMLVTAAVGSLLYADERHKVIDQCRHFVFGIVCLPGAALALFMRLVNSALDSPSAQGDMFVQVLTGNGMPLMFIAIVIIPAFVYAKYVFGGIRTQNRAALSDEESMATYMRQDGFQR